MKSPFTGELLGTMFLIILGDGVVATVTLKRSKGFNSGWLAIATGWGLAVLIGVLVAQSTGSEQADINPAVTLTKFLLFDDVYTFGGMIVIMGAELIGAILGGVVVWLAYYPHFAIETDGATIRGVFACIPAIRRFPSNYMNEAIGTAVLVVGIGGITHASHVAEQLAPILIGGLVWAIGLSLGGPTGYAINPARDLGPRIAHSLLPVSPKQTDWAYAWIPIAGPFAGALIGAGIWYAFIT